MDFQSCFPAWNKLTPAQQELILSTLITKTVKKGEIVHNGSLECTGLLAVRSGQLRVYILSEEGREITIYRMFASQDITLGSSAGPTSHVIPAE